MIGDRLWGSFYEHKTLVLPFPLGGPELEVRRTGLDPQHSSSQLSDLREVTSPPEPPFPSL